MILFITSLWQHLLPFTQLVSIKKNRDRSLLVELEKSYQAGASPFIDTLPPRHLESNWHSQPPTVPTSRNPTLLETQHPETAWSSAPWRHCALSHERYLHRLEGPSSSNAPSEYFSSLASTDLLLGDHFKHSHGKALSLIVF